MTEATIQTPAQEVATIEQTLATARETLKTAQAEFTALMSSGGGGKTIEEQLKISQSALEAAKKVENLESTLASAQKRARVAVLEAPVASFRDAVRKAFTDANLPALMREADAGVGVVVTLAVSSETGDVAVSSRFTSSPAAAKPASGGTGESRGRVAIMADGVGYGATEYLAKYLQGAIDEGKVKWGTYEDRMAFTKDHALRARNLAKVLGHEVAATE